jgi:GR25 family glycosyltransferase involved in LPS biosynthesis
MERIATLSCLTCNFLILLCAFSVGYVVSESSIARIFVAAAFFPLFVRRGLFQDSSDSPSLFKKFSDGKITAYLLNMDGATERLKRVAPQIQDLGFPFERIAAADGSLLSKEEIKSVVDIASYEKYFKMPPETGTVGCSLSHEKAWRKFLESDDEFALIFEDDASFDAKESAEIIKSLVEKKDLWDVVGLELNHRGFPVKIASLPNGRFLAAYLTDVKHAGCYMINRQAARRLLEKFYPIKMPVDHYYTASWEFGLKFAGVEPRPVKQKFEYSQIKTSPKTGKCSPAARISNAVYLFKRHMTHATYNFYYFLLYRTFLNR